MLEPSLASARCDGAHRTVRVDGSVRMTLRTNFSAELHQLQSEVLALGSMVDKAIGRSVDALQRLDHDEARRIIQADEEINRRRFAIEEQAVQLIATQQPMASDLRCIVAAL